MNNFLNEEQYQKTNKKVKLAGIIVMLIGIAMIVIGAIMKVPNMGEAEWFEQSSTKSILIFCGIFVTIVGLMIRFVMANQRKIMAYNLQQMMPLAQEGMETMAPTVGKVGKEIAKEMAPVYGEVAKEISKGIKEGLKEDEEDE